MGTDSGFLRGFEVFSGCSDEELETLSGLLRPRSVGAGEVICRQGEAGDSCYLLVKGTVVVYKELRGKALVTLAPLLSGAIFGQVSLIDGHPRLATCEALGQVRLLELVGDDFRRLVQGRSHFAVAFQREMSRALVRQLRMANQRLAELEDQPDTSQDSGLMAVLGGMTGT